MRRNLIWSVALHLSVLILVVFGLPRLWDTPPPADTPMVVEMVKIDEKTKAEDVAKPKPPKLKPIKTPPPPKPPRAKLSPPTPTPPPPEPPRVLPEPKAEKVPIIKEKPKPKKPKPKKAKPKPKKPKAKTPPRQIVRARPRRRPPPSREDFLKSVLRDVAPEERGEKPKKPPKKIKLTPPAPSKKTPVRRAPLDAQATMSEIAAIRRQIEACWNIPAGARDAGNLVVRIRVWVNPDGTVAQARILDASRMGRDGFFRSAAESALRAVLNPRCSPLRIPPAKYEQFKVLVLHFNPKEATGS
jgi:outer membrane biosynthesis protein TonB